MELTGYSIKAKKKVVLQQPIEIKKNPNGTYMAKGKCPETGNTVCCIMGKDKGLEALAAGYLEVDKFSF